MKTENRTSRRRRILGDILLLSVVLLTADVAAVMPGSITMNSSPPQRPD